MNCEKARQISIKKVLNDCGHREIRSKGKHSGYYFALDRKETEASLLVNYTQNNAYDFGNETYYDTISIVQEIKKCNVSEALRYLDDFSFDCSKSSTVPVEPKKKEKESNYIVTHISKIKHFALIQYLKERKCWEQRKKLREVHYKNTINQKSYFFVGFQTNTGWELRNKYMKSCIGSKSSVLIFNGAEKLRIFEGFFDYLSFLELYPENEFNSDYLILNTTSLIKKNLNLIARYKCNEFYLDNDEISNTGEKRFELVKTYFFFILQKQPDFMKNMSFLYKGYNDLNDFLTRK